MKKIVALFVGLSFALAVSAQAPSNYYNSANGLTGNQLKSALHNIIKGHTSISYSNILNAFWSTDNKGNGVVWDMYSDRPGGTPPYTYYLGQDNCGQYDSEGDCYNREHSWPQSWFNNDGTARTDLHHIFPTDGFVNGMRSNHPYGEVRSSSWVSQNGSKVGTCKTSGYTGTVFEPIDEYKGDLARALMYMSVRYYSEDANWGSSGMTNKAELQPWAIQLLLRWHEQDPVSQKEIDRNNAIYDDFQHNRNPFVDHPEYARMIWDPTWNEVGENPTQAVYLFPNPVERGRTLHLSGNYNSFDSAEVCDMMGRTVTTTANKSKDCQEIPLPKDIRHGCYIVKLMRNGTVVKYEKLLVK